MAVARSHSAVHSQHCSWCWNGVGVTSRRTHLKTLFPYADKALLPEGLGLFPAPDLTSQGSKDSGSQDLLIHPGEVYHLQLPALLRCWRWLTERRYSRMNGVSTANCFSS